MGTHIRVPGPALVALGPSGGTISFFGYTERGVDINEELLETRALADYSGPVLPADIVLAGKAITVTLPMADFDSAVLNTALARYNGGAPGQVQSNEIGTLMYTEGKTFRLMVKASRQATVALYAGDIPGVNIPKGMFRGPIRMPFSTSQQVVNLIFHSISFMNKSNLSGSLWDQDLTGFPTLT